MSRVWWQRRAVRPSTRRGRPAPQRPWRKILFLEPLEGRALPSFVAAPAYPAGPYANAVAVGDFNGDGHQDLAVANEGSTVSVLVAGPGGYHAPVGYAAGSYPTDVTAADLDGDGDLDLAVTDDDSSTNLRILRGNGDGTFQPIAGYTVGARPRAVVAGDFDGDG